MFKVVGMRSWNFNATDLEATSTFYQTLLGAQETPRMSIQGVTVAHLQVGGQIVGIFDAAAGPRPGVPHHTFIGEGPTEPDELVTELETIGIKVHGVRMHGQGPGYSVYVDDPNGNRLELSVDPT